MRQLVTKRIVKELVPIAGADLIELARIDGWQCVVKKGDFSVGNEALYFEIDSMVPAKDPRFAFLAKGKVVEFARIKTIRLKGTLSQGLLMPLVTLTMEEAMRMSGDEPLDTILGVQKYEPPLPTGGKQKGTFPLDLVPKTDQERIQNIPDVLTGKSFLDFEVTEKLDGTSCTIWMYIDVETIGLGDCDINKPEDVERLKNNVVGVASRNWEMQKDDENVYSKVLRDNGLVNKLWGYGRNLAIQGEVIGPGIQGNKYGLTKQEFYVFDIYDIDEKKYLGSKERLLVTQDLGLKHVPVLTLATAFSNVTNLQPIQQGDSSCALTFDIVLDGADGTSQLANVAREGLVFKAKDGSHSFKAISNKWLLKHE